MAWEWMKAFCVRSCIQIMIICIDYPLNIMKYNYNKSTEDWIAHAEIMILLHCNNFPWWMGFLWCCYCCCCCCYYFVTVTNDWKFRTWNWAIFVGVYCVSMMMVMNMKIKLQDDGCSTYSYSLERKQ